MANSNGSGDHGSGLGESKHKYRMTLSLNVLNHLGIGLYSNVPAVVSELVANAWDADAATVHITLSDGRIEVQDTGHGMTLQDINERFLKVGYQRRLASAKTPGGRAAMGRKGIGKLSSFSIANIVEVHTVKDGEANALSMNRQKIEEEIKEDASSEYHPEEIEADVGGLERGTRLVLRQLDRSVSRTPPFLRRRLARRFSIIGPAHGFEVFVDGTPISASDRDFYNKLEFLWHFGQLADAEVAGTIKKHHELDATVVVPTETSAPRRPDKPPAEPQTYPISGWIGTVDRPDSLDDVKFLGCLPAIGPESVMIAILGSPPPGDDGENRRMLAAVNARYITYDQLVRDAERSYAEYLRRDEEVSKLVEIIKGLDEDFKSQGQPST